LYTIEKSNTLVDIPPDREVIVVYDGSINKHKTKFVGYSDIDWGGSLEDMKSTSGYCFSLGSGIFSWCSKKQEIVAKSTAKVEFIATSATVNQVLWFKKFLIDLNME